MSANDPSLINRTTVTISRAVAAVLLIALAAAPVSASREVNKSRFGAVAIKGYDAVAYHLEGKPVQGSKDFVFEWQEATWRFASAENRDRFAAEPQRWAPAYGGWCAYGVSKGGLYAIDPKAWSIVDGTLYLNYSLEVRDTWLEDTSGFIAAANRNWPGLIE